MALSRFTKVIFLLGVLTLAAGLHAHPIMVDDHNVAINGYDTVAYNTQDDAVQGSDRFSTQWEGVTWYFSSARHRSMFEDNPERYAPRYGAHCANAMSNGQKVDSDPEIYRVIDGQLYLYATGWGRLQWITGVTGKIASADEHWQNFREQLGYD